MPPQEADIGTTGVYEYMPSRRPSVRNADAPPFCNSQKLRNIAGAQRCHTLLFNLLDAAGIDDRVQKVRDFEAGLDLGFEARLGGAHVYEFRQNRLRLLERHDDDAVAIADHDIAGFGGDAAERNREPNRPRPVARRRIRREAGAINREADRKDPDKVAHRAVGDEPGNAAIARHAEQQIDGDRSGGESVRGCHKDIAALGGMQRAEKRKIVGGTGVEVTAVPTITWLDLTRA
jgi:hypothetical protein